MEPQSESKSESQSSNFTDNYPQVINDPECKHEYTLAYVDAEGIYNYTCTKCPMGIRQKEPINA
jgi:hypothetical protein